jgi:hypothetical protein
MYKQDIKYISIELFDIIKMIYKKIFFNKHFYFYDKINNFNFNDIIPLLIELTNGEHIKYNDDGFEYLYNKRKINISYKNIRCDIYKFDIFIS